MAKEIKTIKVNPAQETQMIRAHQCFGWTLLSNQEVYSKDSHLDYGYSVTETVHYVKLTFERDPMNLRNYQKLKELENAYFSVPGPGKRPGLLGKIEIGLICIFTIPIGLLVMLFNFLKGATIIAIPIAIIIAIRRVQKKKLAIWQNANRKFWEKRECILQQANSYL